MAPAGTGAGGANPTSAGTGGGRSLPSSAGMPTMAAITAAAIPAARPMLAHLSCIAPTSR
ncbi:MAG: hypothetical protein ACJ75Z_02560 [Solirubrobacterales bacterium]